jgi:uncharacterized protein (TIGR02452 family)
MEQRLNVVLPPITAEDYALSGALRQRLIQATMHIGVHGSYVNPEQVEIMLTGAIAQMQQRQYVIEPAQSIPIGRGRYGQTHTFVHQNSVIEIAQAWAQRGFRVGMLHHVRPESGLRASMQGEHSQEATLYRSSLLSLTPRIREWYDEGYQSLAPMYDARLLVSPQVPFVRTHVGDLLVAPWYAGVVSAAPVHVSRMLAEMPEYAAEVPMIMLARMQRIFRAFAAMRANVVVVSAWGCGHQGGDAGMLADIYATVLADAVSRHFAVVDVAMPGGPVSHAWYGRYRDVFHERTFPHA